MPRVVPLYVPCLGVLMYNDHWILSKKKINPYPFQYAQ